MTALELRHVAGQVLRRHPVEHADVAALKHRPERFDPVRVDLTADVLLDAVLDGVVVTEPLVGRRLVGVERGVGSRVPRDEPRSIGPLTLPTTTALTCFVFRSRTPATATLLPAVGPLPANIFRRLALIVLTLPPM